MRLQVVPFQRGDVEHTLKFKGDRSSLEELLSTCTPVFVYSDRGREWVRWAFPAGLLPGIEDKTCPCCGKGALPNPDGGVYLDTAYDDVAWRVRAEVRT